MNVALWIVAWIAALGFLASGVMKATRPKAQLQTNMGWVEDFSTTQVKAIGVLEILGAIGLIVPGLTGIAPVLVPIAATGLALVMIGAAVVHVRRKEPQLVVVNLVLFLLVAFVAWGRFGPYPL